MDRQKIFFNFLEKKRKVQILKIRDDPNSHQPETESESNCRIIRFDSIRFSRIESNRIPNLKKWTESNRVEYRLNRIESNRIEYYLTDSGN